MANRGIGFLAIGNEVAEGRVANNNGQWLARRFGQIRQMVVSDDKRQVIAALEHFKDCRLVVVCGGLGPTVDDMTRAFVCSWLKCGLKTHAPTLARIRKKMKLRGEHLFTPNNIVQAEYPAKARPLYNPPAGAVCFTFNKGVAAYYFLPGVPQEFRDMVVRHVRAPNARPGSAAVFHFIGIPESTTDSILQSILPARLKTAYGIYPGPMGVHVVLRASRAAATRFSYAVRSSRLAPYLAAEGDFPPEQILVKKLIRKKLTIAAAESCTAGLFTGILANVPGASAILNGGVTAYANRVKIRQLGVPPALIARHGAVSAECAAAMAAGVRKSLGSDIGISITGVAGPSGGTREKPVGTVYFGFALGRRLVAEKMVFGGERNHIRAKSAYHAIYRLAQLIEAR